MPPPALTLVDAFAGDPATTPLTHEQDIAPAKPRTDLIIRATARSYQGDARRDWPVSVSIPDVLTTGFHVRGPFLWRKQLGRWKLTQPDLVTDVPLTFALAYGGSCQQGDTTHFFDQNPAGQGFMTDAAAPRDGWHAPQIGLLADFMAAQPFAPMTVCGTMPIAKGWLPRRSRAGTFDAKWERDRHPRMPLDYDLGFWNAPPLRLPGARLVLQSDAGDTTPMVLDTVDIDLADIDDGTVTLTLLWRAMVPDRDAYRTASIVKG